MSTTREKKNQEEASPAQQKPFPEGELKPENEERNVYGVYKRKVIRKSP